MGGACAGVQTGGKRLHDQISSPASMRSRSESWCPEGLREALASEPDDLDRQKKAVLKLTGSIESTRGGGGRRKAGGGGRSEEDGGRREEGGVWREGGEREGRRREYPRQYKARTYLLSRSLLAASTIMLEAMDEQGSVLEKLWRPQIDKINALEGSRRR